MMSPKLRGHLKWQRILEMSNGKKVAFWIITCVFFCVMLIFVCFVWWYRGEKVIWIFYSSEGELLARGVGGEGCTTWRPLEVPWREAVSGKTGIVRVSTQRGQPIECIEYRDGMQDGAYVEWNGDKGVCVFQWYRQDELAGLDIRLDNGGISVVWDGKQVAWSGKGIKKRNTGEQGHQWNQGTGP